MQESQLFGRNRQQIQHSQYPSGTIHSSISWGLANTFASASAFADAGDEVNDVVAAAVIVVLVVTPPIAFCSVASSSVIPTIGVGGGSPSAVSLSNGNIVDFIV